MSDHQPEADALPPAPEPAAELPPPPPPPPARRSAAGPLVLALGAVVIAIVVAFLVLFPFGSGPQGPRPADQVAALQGQVRALTAQVRQLAARPAGDPARLAALEQQVGALRHAPHPAAPDLGRIEQRLSKLEQKQANPAVAPNLRPVEQRLSALEQQVAQLKAAAGATPSHTAQDLAPLQAQVSKLAAEQQQLRAQLSQAGDTQAAVKALAGRLDQQQQTMAKLASDLRTASADAGQAMRTARVEAALIALDAGRPLGAVPDAPAAVARFARQAPPTLDQLRAGFPDVAKAVLAASRPAEGQRFWSRLWTNTRDLVTVRRGDKVLVGDPAAGFVARARDALDRGDLRGAVQALSQLNGPAAQAAAGWLGSARAVLAARAALLGMAGAA